VIDEMTPSHSLDVLASLTPAVPAALARLAEGWDTASTPVAPRSAASVVLCRDGESGLETYLLHRHARMAFAASMAVFPGGGVDPVDGTAADPLLACGIRETWEETGVDLTGTGVVRWAHWITPVQQPIRYDTFFYLAALPPGQTATDRSSETDRAGWTTPAAAVAAYASGDLALMPPTLSILSELAGLGAVADALELAQGRVIETVLPEVVRGTSGWVYSYPRPRGGADR
jgi:8-oxo-dGTP pyrophosphatase MutT (NUDIX family)